MLDATELSTDNFEGDWKFGVKKPIPIQVIQLNLPEGFKVVTNEGVMEGKPGDYLAIGVKGERYPIAKDIFEKTYTIVAKDSQIRQVDTGNIQAFIQSVCKGILTLLPESNTVAVIVGETSHNKLTTVSTVVPKGREYKDLDIAARNLIRVTNDVLSKVEQHPDHPKPKVTENPPQ